MELGTNTEMSGQRSGDSSAGPECLKALMEAIPSTALFLDADGNLIYHNKYGEFCADPGEWRTKGLVSRDGYYCLNALEVEKCGANALCETCPIRSTVKHVLATGEAVSAVPGRLRVVKDGVEESFDFFVTARPVEGGGEARVLAVITDIADRKLDLKRLKVNHEIFSRLSEGIHLVRLSDMTIARCNPALSEIYGYPHGEMEGMRIEELLSARKGDPATVLGAISHSVQREGSWRGELLSRRKDGTEFWTLTGISSFHDPDLGLVSLCITTDISAQKKAQKQRVGNLERLNALTGLSRIEGSNLDGLCSYSLKTLLYLTESKIGFLDIYDTAKGTVAATSFSAPEGLDDGGISASELKARLWENPTPHGGLVLVNGNMDAAPSLSGPLKRRLLLPVTSKSGLSALVGLGLKEEHYTDLDVTQVEAFLAGVRAHLEKKAAEEKAIESQNLFLAFVEASPSMIYIKDAKGRFLFVNEHFAKAYGKRPKGILGLTSRQLHSDQELAEDYEAQDREVLETGAIVERISRAADRKGRLRDELVIKFPIRNSRGKTTAVGGISIDITDRIRMEAELDRERARAESYYDLVDALTVSLDREGVITAINPKACKVLGYDRQELLGRNWFQTCLSQPLGMEVVYPHFKSMVAGEGEMKQQFTNTIVTRSGEERLIEWHNAIMRDEEGRIIGTLSSGQDVTEQKRDREELLRRQEELLQMQRIGHISTYRWDLGAGRISWSQEFANISGRGVRALNVTAEELLNMVLPEDRAQFSAHFSELLAGQHDSSLDYCIEMPDGKIKHITGKATVEVGENGEPAAIIGYIQDISGIKKAEEDRKRLQTQIGQAQKMEALGTLSGGIAHDFNNILGAILGYSELCAMDASLKPDLKEYVNEILQAARRAKDLVRQILAFSRRTTLETESVDLHLVVSEAVKLMKATIPSFLELKQKIDRDTGSVTANPGQLHQVVMNLCTNAYQAMRDLSQGVLTIELGPAVVDSLTRQRLPDLPFGDYALLKVSDTGHGIDPSVLPRIFDPFYTTKAQGEGTGLGLSVVHGIVSSLGGAIEVESRLGAGTVFSIYLPVTLKAAAAKESGQVERIKAGARILVVDDEPVLGKLMSKILSAMGAAVTVASSGEEALLTLRKCDWGFDLVITDQTMPRMPGSELLSRIKEERPDLPVVICTGYSDLINEEKARSLGAFAMLLKPLDRVSIADVVARAVNKG